ncbi:unnamed protein product, partial [Meganyctiphanes norvegica]
ISGLIMPPKRSKPQDDNGRKYYMKYTEKDLKNALCEYRSETGKSRRAIGRKYGISETTLRKKLSGELPETRGHTATGRRMTDQEEQVLMNWIDECQRRAMPVSRLNVIRSMEDILAKEQDEL